MISSQFFVTKVSDYFAFLVSGFDFEFDDLTVREDIYYEQRFNDGRKVVSISYENLEDYLKVTVYLLENGQLPAYDDEQRTLLLGQINAAVFPNIGKTEIEQNNNYFACFQAQSEFEKHLLKQAKDLRLSLKYFPIFVLDRSHN